jgi:hypothetical protein
VTNARLTIGPTPESFRLPIEIGIVKLMSMRRALCAKFHTRWFSIRFLVLLLVAARPLCVELKAQESCNVEAQLLLAPTQVKAANGVGEFGEEEGIGPERSATIQNRHGTGGEERCHCALT